MKKLGHDSEFQTLDEKICRLSGKKAGYCHPAHYIKALALQFKKEPSSLDYAKLNEIDLGTEILSCSRSQRLVDLLVSRAAFHESGVASVENVLTMLMLNPEPLLFMAFDPEEGWPFPKYLGSCGRIAIFEDKGRQTMAEAYFKPWDFRAKVARNLLKMAVKFIDNEDRVAIYMTDWSSDNLAVDKYGDVTIVDGEGVVLVDKKLVEDTKAPGWDVKHANDLCHGKFCFHPEDLCTHKDSDLNLLGVCAGFLANAPFNRDLPHGLLHGIPSEVSRRHPLLSRLVEECARPTNKHPGGRFEAAQEILEILRHL